jgi:putative salt-induced outer membrane protein
VNHRHLSAASCLLALTVSVARSANADDLPPGTMKTQQATKGTESIATSGFETKAKPDEATSKDALDLKVSAGGLSSEGNARSIGITSSAKFRIRRETNQLSVALGQNYGRAATSPDADTAITVENYQGRARYDRFLGGGFAVFVAMSGLRDRFQGLDLRLNLDPGIAYYFVDEAKQQFWSELGYDLQYDFRRTEKVLEAFNKGTPIDKAETRHSGRLFLGYQNSLNKAVTLDTGLEYLQALSQTENWRLNWMVGLNSQIGGDFSIALTFNLKYDNNPLPGVKNTDAVTAISLVYSLL